MDRLRDRREVRTFSRINLGFVLIFLAVFAVFANCIQGSFLWDDQQFFLENRFMREWSSLPELFTHSMVAGSGQSSNLYRPLQSLTHFLDLRVWGGNASGHRTLNVLLHALGAGLWFFVFLRLLGRDERASREKHWAAFAITLLYFTHPLHSADVGYVSGRGGTMVLFFAGIAALAFGRSLLATLGAVAAAILSKESGLLVPVFLLGFDWVTREKEHLSWKWHASSFALGLAYLALRATILNFQNFFNFYNSSNILTENFSYRIFTYLSTWPKALELIFWPTDIHHERSWLVYADARELSVIAGGAIVVILAVIIAFACAKQKRYTAMGLSWLLIATAPTSNLIILINALFYDHWVILPGLGLFIVALPIAERSLAYGFGTWRARLMLACTGLALFLLLPITLEQNRIWRQPISMYEHVLRFEPRSAKMMNNLAMHLEERNGPGDRARAIELYQKSISIADTYPETHHNLALAYMRSQQMEMAEREFKRAIEMNSRFHHSHAWLGRLYLTEGRVLEATASLRRALELFPDPMTANWLREAEARASAR